MTLSGKFSLILGENKAVFCREGHIYPQSGLVLISKCTLPQQEISPSYSSVQRELVPRSPTRRSNHMIHDAGWLEETPRCQAYREPLET